MNKNYKFYKNKWRNGENFIFPQKYRKFVTIEHYYQFGFLRFQKSVIPHQSLWQPIYIQSNPQGAKNVGMRYTITMLRE